MSNNNWFEHWFDSPYYPILYQHRNYKEASEFIDFLINHLNLSENKDILDLACGEGRHSIHLNHFGHRVTGIDLSIRSIEIAKKSENSSLNFAQKDMRDFELNQSFDLIFNLFTSFGYFDTLKDNKKVLQSVHRHLNDEGLLIIDFFNAKKVERERTPFEIKILNQVLYVIQKTIENGKIVKKISIYDKNDKKVYYEKVQLIDLNKFEEMLHANGFKIKETYGDYVLNPFDELNSDRLVIFAEKL